MIAYPPSRRTGAEISPQRSAGVTAPQAAEVAPVAARPPRFPWRALYVMARVAWSLLRMPLLIGLAYWLVSDWAAAGIALVWAVWRFVTGPRGWRATSGLARVERAPRRWMR